MAGNIITWNEALDLAGKLLNEETPVHASSFSPSGLRARVRGFIDSITDSNGLVVSSVRPPSDAVAWMAVPLRRRDATCYFGDKRDFAEVGREELAPTYGDTVLAFHFNDSNDLLILFFSL
jgi:hypothetical protein